MWLFLITRTKISSFHNHVLGVRSLLLINMTMKMTKIIVKKKKKANEKTLRIAVINFQKLKKKIVFHKKVSMIIT